MGFYFIKSLNTSQKYAIVDSCLSKLDNIGAKVVSVCCDSPPSNISFSNKMGVKLDPFNFITKFENRNTFFLLDPAHMMKLVRNAFKFIGILKFQNDPIEWKYIAHLHQLVANNKRSLLGF